MKYEKKWGDLRPQAHRTGNEIVVMVEDWDTHNLKS